MDVSGSPLHWLAQGEEHVPAERGWLSPLEADRAAGMAYAKRRNDFLVSRWTAKQALTRFLGAGAGEPDQLEVRPAPTGAPVAYLRGEPADCSVSLTDRAGWAVCLVGPPGHRLGCDLELVEERTDRFVADWFTPAEREFVAVPGTDHDVVANLVWSAKESALKVLQTGLRRDTRTVEVSFGDDRHDGWRSMSVRAVEGPVFPGWWCRHGDFLLTVAAEQPFPPPESLVQPSPLGGALPSHSWMDDFS